MRLKDGRIGAVSSFAPLGDDDRVVFPDGHEERSDAWEIAEMLTDEPDLPLIPFTRWPSISVRGNSGVKREGSRSRRALRLVENPQPEPGVAQVCAL